MRTNLRRRRFQRRLLNLTDEDAGPPNLKFDQNVLATDSIWNASKMSPSFTSLKPVKRIPHS